MGQRPYQEALVPIKGLLGQHVLVQKVGCITLHRAQGGRSPLPLCNSGKKKLFLDPMLLSNTRDTGFFYIGLHELNLERSNAESADLAATDHVLASDML